MRVLKSPSRFDKSTSKYIRRLANILPETSLLALLDDSDGTIDDSCEGIGEGDRCCGRGVVTRGVSCRADWLNASLDCLRIDATEREGCDLVIANSSSGKLWLYVLFDARDPGAIADALWWCFEK